MLKRFISFVVVAFCVVVPLWSQTPKVRVSGWYWLNSAPKTDWQGDFITMKNLGFTDVTFAWGIDSSAYIRRLSETRQAMQWAHEAGLGTYLCIWHPYANSLHRRPEFMEVDSDGHQLGGFDIFNPKWRNTEWKDYLQTIAKTFHNQPGMAGYVFDDTFAVIDGTRKISYGAYEQRVFGKPLPKNPGDHRWDEWVKVRQGWWEDWARDTVKFIRTVDSNRQHEIYVEDGLSDLIEPTQLNNIGLDFPRVARHFDAVGGYTSVSWDDSPDSGVHAAQKATDAITNVRKIVGPDQKLVYTFWIANYPDERKPGPAKYPTAEQIRLVCEAALKLGIHHVDMYGYRIGDSSVNVADWPKWVPQEPAPYRLTGQFPQKFLWDRPEIHEDLSHYLRTLNQKK